MKKIAVLISNAGRGSNLQAIIDAIENKSLAAKIAVVISDKEDAYGLMRAKKHHLPTLIVNRKTDLKKILTKKYHVDFVALAGWKQIIPETFTKQFNNRILNVHPGLIPDDAHSFVKNPDGTKGLWNQGKFTDRAAKNFLDKKCTYAGSSVHFLTQEVDFGPVLARCFEKVMAGDTVESLYSRLKQKENVIYVKALIKICN